MRRSTIARSVLVAALGAACLGVSAPSSFAKGIEVRTVGRCTDGSTAKLRVKTDNGRLAVDWEVDTPRVGQVWTWALIDNAATVASGSAVTTAPSGSFTVTRLVANAAGADVVSGTATNGATGATCVATLTFPA